jgi:hypothetical protein
VDAARERERERRNGPERPKPNSACRASPPGVTALSRLSR